MKRFFYTFLCCVMQLALAGCFTSLSASAQELALSTNFVDYARTGTANLETSYALARHWSVNVGVKYDSGGEMRQQLYSVGGRYWPWHIYSGWWLSGKMQYQEFYYGLKACIAHTTDLQNIRNQVCKIDGGTWSYESGSIRVWHYPY